MNKKNFMKGLVIFGIIILPLLYSLFYLKGFWDPYNSLDDVPVALVNLDDKDRGSELIDKLLEEDVFDFDVVTSDEAMDGLISEDYYAVITIPEDFTNNLTNDMKQVTITYTPNTKSNYLASQIIGNAVSEIEEELQSEVTGGVTDELVYGLEESSAGLNKVASSLDEVENGTDTLFNSSKDLSLGVSNLNTSYLEFDSGISRLYDSSNLLYSSYSSFDQGLENAYLGAKELKEGVSNLDVSGITELKSGSDQFTSGLSTYVDGVSSLVSYSESASTVISSLCSSGSLTGYDELCQVSSTISFNELSSSGEVLINSNKSINEGINSLNSSISSLEGLKSGIESLESGLYTLSESSNDIYDGLDKLNDGLETLRISSLEISEGIDSLSLGSDVLSSGVGSLDSGIKSLNESVASSASSLENEVSSLDGIAEYSADSVLVEEDDYGQVEQYGIFFSPYFMSLSLWVGGVLILMGLYYDPDKRFKVLGRNSNNRVLRMLLYYLIGIIQAILLGLVLKLSLGYEVTNIYLYYGSCILISEAFLSIIMFLFFNFQDIGKFLALVLLVLQLASCGGTFPIETEPAFYTVIYNFMPMTYSVDLLRESLVSINTDFVIKDSTILFGIFALFTILIFVTGYIKTKKNSPKVQN